MKIATWNVNSLKARLVNVLVWLDRAKPDVVCLQEIKCQTADFPEREIRAAGYHAVVQGQKSYNGVALLSREPAQDVLIGLPGDPEDAQARYVEARFGDIRVASLYLPNGNPVGTDKYPQARLDGAAAAAGSGLARDRGRLRARRRLQCLPRRRRCLRPGRLARRRAVPAGKPRRLPDIAQFRPDRGVPDTPSRAASL